MKTINDDGLALIKKFEGFRAKPYNCPAGVPTIGYGATRYPDGTKVTLKDKEITEAEASVLLKSLLEKEFVPQVSAAVKVTLTENQLAALVSFTYNLGLGNFKQSTLLRCTNARNWDDAARAFLMWNKARVKGELQVLAGLTARRKAEAELFLK